MKIKRLLVKLLQCLMLFFMAIILYICITGTAHNIVWYKELIVTTGFLAIIFLFLVGLLLAFLRCLLICKFRFEFETRAFAHDTYHREVVAVEGIFEPHARAKFYFGLKFDFKRF